MAEERAQRRLTAILAADAVEYSRIIRADEAGALHDVDRPTGAIDGLFGQTRDLVLDEGLYLVPWRGDAHGRF